MRLRKQVEKEMRFAISLAIFNLVEVHLIHIPLIKLGSVGITTCSDIEFEFEPSSLIRKRDGGPKENEGMFVDVEPSKLLDAIAGTRASKLDCK